jgi:hypothetical protein
MVFKPGTYEHECSACGHKVTFTVQGLYCATPPRTHYVDVGQLPLDRMQDAIEAWRTAFENSDKDYFIPVRR